MTWTHLRDETVTARKSHSCDLCGEPIATGDRYLLRTGIDAGYGHVSVPMHVECEAVTRDWDVSDWECRDPAEFVRPGRAAR